MHHSRTIGLRITAAAAISFLLQIGCAGSGGVERFIPSEPTARRALETALEAWRGGKPAGAVENTSPVVFITDTHRRPGQTLSSFEILGEVPGNAPRCFAVKLHFSQPDGEERARFVIVGIDPLWVYRQEDYDLLAHWEHKMPPPDDAATSKGGDSVGKSSGTPAQSK